MNRIRLFLVRHGQTDYNLKHLLQGSGINSSLNQTGKNEAETLKNTHKLLKKTDMIYSSPLERAVQTGEIVTGLNRDSFKMDSRLRERGFGMHEGKPYDRNSISKLIQMSDDDAKSQGIETIPEIKERISLFLIDLCNEHNQKQSKESSSYEPEEKTIFIFSHGAFIKNFVDYIMGCNAEIPDDQRSKLKMIPFNCHFHEIQISYDCNKKYYKIIRLNEGF